MSLKTEAVVSSVSTSGAPLSPLVEPHSNTSTPLVDEPQMTTQRQRNGIGDDGEQNVLYFNFTPSIMHSVKVLEQEMLWNVYI